MFFKRTLGFKIILFFLLVALFPFMGLSLLFYLQAKENISNIAKENLSNLSHQLGIEVEKTIFSAYTNIKSLAENPILKSDKTSIQEKLTEMKKVHNLYKVFEDITLVNLDGIVLTSTTFDYRGDWKYKHWFKQALKGESIVSPVHPILRPFRLIIAATTPILSEGDKITTVLAGRINMTKIWEITDRVKVGKSGFVFLTNKEGTLLAYPHKDELRNPLKPERLRKEMFKYGSGTIEYATERSEGKICYYETLKGYQQYKGQGWRIGIIQDQKEAYSLIEELQVRIFWVAIAGLIFILLLAILLTINIVRPVKILNRAADRIIGEDLTARVEVTSKDELGNLSKSFNKMAETVEEYTKNLEDMVEKRTAELKATHEQLVRLSREMGMAELATSVLHNIGNA
ncbi:cache domain-containing protein, partial [Candidatus Auribacterota bacterium]